MRFHDEQQDEQDNKLNQIKEKISKVYINV